MLYEVITSSFSLSEAYWDVFHECPWWSRLFTASFKCSIYLHLIWVPKFIFATPWLMHSFIISSVMPVHPCSTKGISVNFLISLSTLTSIFRITSYNVCYTKLLRHHSLSVFKLQFHFILLYYSSSINQLFPNTHPRNNFV